MAPPHLIRTEAIVLRRHDFGEADRLLTLYTLRGGKIRAIAKGIRRPTSRLGGHLELFTHCELMVARGRNLDTITQVETINSFSTLRDDLWRTSLAYYAGELVDRLTEEHSENSLLFGALISAISRIAEGVRPLDALHHFELQALALLGFKPELRACVQCRQLLQPVQNAFSLTAGGVLCPKCRESDPLARGLSANALKILRLGLDDNWETMTRIRLDSRLNEEVEQTLTAYIQFVAETQLKSAGFVASLRRDGLATVAPGSVSTG